MKSFLELWKMIEAEELGTNKPVPLSKITPQVAQAATSSGNKDSNPPNDPELNIKANPEDTAPVASLKPMQKEVIPAKALGMAIGYLLNGKPSLDDMEAIVSSDNYIMDGHHRWAAATLIDPNKQVKVARIGIPASQLVTALNLWTKAKGRSGNPGKGDVTQFANTIPGLIDQMINSGTPDSQDKDGNVIKGFSPEQIKQALGKIPGANGDANQGANIMKSNATKLPTQRHPDAPERVDMPVVNGKQEINDVIQKLLAGDIDWNAPLSQNTLVAKGTTNTNVGAGVATNASNQATSMQNATQQNVGAMGQNATQQNVGAFQPQQQQQSQPQQQNPNVKKFPQQQNQPQRQVASTSHDGPSLNEWLILAGVKTDN